MRKAISYIRLSSQEQLSGSGHSRQLELTENYALKNGFKLIKNLEDLGLSGYKGHHTEKGKLGEFLGALKNNELEDDIVLLVESLDRLSRQSPTTAFNQFIEILNYGIEIHTILDNQIYTKESVDNNAGQLFLSIGIMMRAYNESDVKSKRISDSWNKKKEEMKKGKILTKQVPAWIEVDKVNNKFKLKPNETKILQEIFNLSIHQGMGLFSLTRYLNDNIDKYPKFNTHFNKNEWGTSYINKLFNSPTVYGAILLKKKTGEEELLENYYPSAITKETYLLNREKIKERSVALGRKGDTYSNLFKGILKCSNCGGNIIHRRKTPKDEYLSCTNKIQHKSGCQAYNWNYKEFEKSFFESVLELDIESIFRKPDDKNKITQLKKTLIARKDNLNELIKRKEKLIDLIEEDFNSSSIKDLKKRIEERNIDIEKIENDIQRIEIELLNLKKINPKKTQEGLIRGWTELLSSNKTKEEIKYIRTRMASIIRDIIDSIVVVNNPFILPDIYDNDDLDEKFTKKYFETKKKRSVFKNFNDFISSDYGIRKLAEWERHYIVKFKNGEIRYVHPSKGSFLFKYIKNEFLKHKK